MASQESASGVKRGKVFISYSRADVGFADQLVGALGDMGFDPVLDRHDIDAAENWRARLGALILDCDAIVFVLTDASAGSEICTWEVAEAERLNKRIVPVLPRALSVSAPSALSTLNYVGFYEDKGAPGSGFYDGLRKLERALSVNLEWLRRQTRLLQLASEWQSSPHNDLLLRGVALEEARTWSDNTPADQSPPGLILTYLEAAELADAKRRDEAEQSLRQRAIDLEQKEAALAAKTKSDRLARRFASIGSIVAVVLSTLAVILSVTAWRAMRLAGESRAEMFGAEAYARLNEDRNAEALLIALGGDPAAKNDVFARLVAPQGYATARNALVAAYTHNRLQRTFVDLNEPIQAVAVSARGTMIALAPLDGPVRILDSVTGEEQHVLSDARNSRAVTFSDDGARLLTSGSAVQVWNVSTGERSFQSFAGVLAAWRPGSAQFVMLTRDSELQIVDAATGAVTTRAPFHGGHAIRALAVSPDGERLAVTAGDNVEILDIETGQRVLTLAGHRGAVSSIAFSSNGARLVTGAADHFAVVWDSATGSPIQVLEGHEDEVMAVAISPDGGLVATGSKDEQARLWDIVSGRTIATLRGGAQTGRAFMDGQGWVSSLAFSSDGDFVLTGSYDRVARLWRIEEGVFSPTPAPIGALVPHSATEVLIGLQDGRVGRFDLDRAIFTPLSSALGAPARSIAVAGRSEFVASGNADGVIRGWDADGSDRFTLREDGLSESVDQIAISPDGRLLVAGYRDGTTLIWDLRQSRVVRRLGAADTGIRTVVFSPDGERVLVGELSGHATLWDVAAGTPVFELDVTGDEGLVSGAFSHDGRLIVTGAYGAITRIWDASNGSLVTELRGHRAGIRSVSFSADDTLLLTAGGDNLVRVWDVATGRLLVTITDRHGGGRSMFLPNGRTIVTFMDGGGVRRWVLDDIVFASAGDQVRSACDALVAMGTPSFTTEDRQRFPILDDDSYGPCANAIQEIERH